jgi:hypothetical protein
VSSNDELAVRVAALKVISDLTSECYNEARAELGKRMQRGDRLMARSPLDGAPKIGAVTLSDPKTVAQISDARAFGAWVAENYPDRMERDYEIVGSHQEVAAVLFENAPHLLRPVVKPDPELVKQVRQDSAKLGCPIGPSGEADVPGVVVSTPDGVVACKPDPDALAAVIDLFRADKLTLESLTFPELPGGAA